MDEFSERAFVLTFCFAMVCMFGWLTWMLIASPTPCTIVREDQQAGRTPLPELVQACAKDRP